MIQKNYFPKGTQQQNIILAMKQEGFDPQLITDKPGFVYKTHTHEETKYITCVSGSMKVTVAGKSYDFEPGDKMIIGAKVPHSAIVGKDGCVYFWSEKIV